MTNPRFRPALLGPILVALGASMWGLETFWRVRLSRHFTADVLVFHEHWIGLLLTLPFVAFGWRSLRTASRRAWISILVSGVLGSALGTVCFTRALVLVNPSIANLLLNLQPIVSVFASWLWLRERPMPAFYFWAAVAILCGLGLAWDPAGLRDPHVLATGLLLLAGTIFSWGVSTTAGRGAMLEIDFRTAVTLRYAIGAVTMLVVVTLTGGESGRFHATELFTRPVLVDFLELLVIAAITPTFIYFAGLARTPASVATFAEMAQTFASLLITWGVMGNALTGLQCAAGVVLLIAVAMLNRAVEIASPAPA